VLHSTGGAFAGAVSWMMSLAGKVSAHFVVSRTGEIRQLVSIYRVAYHAGAGRWPGVNDNRMNDCSIGIEMEHVDGKQDWTYAQVSSVAALVSAIRQKFPKITTANIIGHRDWAPGRKVDPKDFPWATFRPMVR
jgi:N-acetylmuramoyl-L-alanine amidase